MKQRRMILSLVITLVTLFAIGCSDDNPIDTVIEVTGIEIDVPEKQIAVDESFQLKVTVIPEDANNKEVTWESSNPEVAEVDIKGKVTGVSEGTTTITAITVDGAKTARCVVTVEELSVPVEAISITPTEITLDLGDYFTVTATIIPLNAGNQLVAWTSSDAEIAEVDEEGQVYAKAVGEVTITVTSEEGGKTAECVITVQEAGWRPKLAIEYVADFNINPSGDGLTTSNIETSGYFTWDEAMEKFAEDNNFSVNGTGYHLPTESEWIGIIPGWGGGNNIRFNGLRQNMNYPEIVTIAGETVDYKSDYNSPGQNITYALRYKEGNNDTHRSAYRYHYTSSTENTEVNVVEIRVRYLGPDRTDITVLDISDESWWTSDSEDDIIRVLPALGSFSSPDEIFPPSNWGERGHFWSATEEGSNPAQSRRIEITPSWADSSNKGNKTLRCMVRLFSNE